MVRRPYLKKENHFVDAELPNIHSRRRGSHSSLKKRTRVHGQNFIVVEKQTLSRQVSALRHIQDDCWKLYS